MPERITDWEKLKSNAGKHCWVYYNGRKLFDIGTFKELPYEIKFVHPSGDLRLQKGDLKKNSECFIVDLLKENFNRYEVDLLNY